MLRRSRLGSIGPMKRPKPKAGKKLPDSFVEGANPPYPERYKKGPETFSGVLRTNGGNRGCVNTIYAKTGTIARKKDRIWLKFYQNRNDLELA